MVLPVYDLFDETAYFQPASQVSTVTFKDVALGIMIGEDLWSALPGPFSAHPLAKLAEEADLIINIAAFPFYMGWEEQFYQMAADSARASETPLLLVNQVGANDEWVFNGQSLFLTPYGEPVAVAPSFQEHTTTIETKDLTPQNKGGRRSVRYMML